MTFQTSPRNPKDCARIECFFATYDDKDCGGIVQHCITIVLDCHVAAWHVLYEELL